MKPSDDSRTGAMKDMLFHSFRKLTGGVTSSLPSLRNTDDLEKLEGEEDWSTIEYDSDDDVDFSNISDSDSCVEKEQVAGRDYPHSRHVCSKFPFEETPHESHCELCYCYVCEFAAPCKKWSEGHCDAFDIERWSLKRQLKRETVERKKEVYKKQPHPRYMCVDFPYEKTTHHEHCELCYCYVCETDAPCEKWVGTSNHCDAINNKKWRTERQLRSKQNAPLSEAATVSLHREESNQVHQEHPQEEQISKTRSTGSLVEIENNEISEETQVRVENLPLSMNSLELAALFQRAGVVEMAEIMYADSLPGGCRISQGFGFVTMGTIEEVDKAVHLFNGYYLEKNAITVNRIKFQKTNSKHVGKLSHKHLECMFELEIDSDGSTEGENDEETKVRVGNLPSTVNSYYLTELFHRAGAVIECEIMYDDHKPSRCRTSRGFGFVTMSTIEEADKAVHLFNCSYLEKTPITVNRIKLGRHEKTYNIHIDNLSYKMNDKRLEELFRGHGYNVMRVSSLANLEYWARGNFGPGNREYWGIGFVEMASHWEREDAVSALDGMMVCGRKIKLTITNKVFKQVFASIKRL